MPSTGRTRFWRSWSGPIFGLRRLLRSVPRGRHQAGRVVVRARWKAYVRGANYGNQAPKRAEKISAPRSRRPAGAFGAYPRRPACWSAIVEGLTCRTPAWSGQNGRPTRPGPPCFGPSGGRPPPPPSPILVRGRWKAYGSIIRGPSKPCSGACACGARNSRRSKRLVPNLREEVLPHT